jgi:hypothetical protein
MYELGNGAASLLLTAAASYNKQDIPLQPSKVGSGKTTECDDLPGKTRNS